MAQASWDTSLPSTCKALGVKVVLGIPPLKAESNNFVESVWQASKSRHLTS